MSKLDWLEARQVAVETHETALHRFAVNLDERVDRHPWISFSLFSTLYLIVVFSLSSMKLLWLDELITLHIAQLNSLPAIWHALQRGVDPNPPITYLLVALSTHLFGNHEFAYRLPAAIGYWVGLISLFVFLRRRVPATWALAGTALSTTMAAFDYSYESRSYGIFYGLAMLAVLCWSRTVDSRASRTVRRLWLVGMTAALALGISVNYFAVLAFLPVAAGEAARAMRRSRDLLSVEAVFRRLSSSWYALDGRIWIAFLIAGSPLLLYRPLIEHSIAQFAPYAWNRVSWGQVCDSYLEMVECMLYPALALIAFGIGVRLVAQWTKSTCPHCRSRLLPRWLTNLSSRSFHPPAVPLHEGVAVLSLMAYPILGYIIASIRSGMLSPRFVIPVCFGFAIAVTLVAFQLFGHFRPAGVAMLCLALAWLLCRESYVGYWYEEQKQSFYKILDRLPQAEASVPRDAPIVVSDPLMVLTFQHYAPAEIASRIVFPVDFPAIRFFRHDDSPEENLWAGRNFIYDIRILPLADFQNHAGKYLILASDGNWLLDDLATHRYGFYPLEINTRAQAIGGFTPLAHGTPAFYIGFGGATPASVLSHLNLPVPFKSANNLPEARSFIIPKAVE